MASLNDGAARRQSPQDDIRKDAAPRVRKRICREDLERMYVHERLPVPRIVELTGANRVTVFRWLRRYGIQPRGQSTLSGMSDAEIKDRLTDMYVSQRLSSTQIAKRLDMAHSSVLKRLAKLGIVRRKGAWDTLAGMGVTPPSKGQLEDLIHVQHKTYKEIGTMFGGVTDVAVKEWVKKHGVRRPTSSYTITKGRLVGITPEELRRLHIEECLSLREIGDKYGVNATTISRLMVKLGVVALPPGARRILYVADSGNRVRSSYELKVDNWLHSHGLRYEYDPAVPFSPRHRADFKVNDSFIEIWGVTASPAYEKTKAWKQSKYTAFGLRLLELMPADFTAAAEYRWASTLAEHINE